ncbi:MAG: lasso RiPP family leader peptide-containing protein [Pseudonocardiaceae bacterium]
MSESPVPYSDDAEYEQPALVEVGDFAELTLGTVGQISDDGALRDN